MALLVVRNPFERAEPVRARYIDGLELQAMTLCIFHQGRGAVKTHGLIVQNCGGKSGQIVALQISAGIADQRKTGGVRFGKSVQRERGDGLNDSVLYAWSDSLLVHATTQFFLNVFHARRGAFEAEGAPQFLGFAACESRGDHGHAQQLFLKERHTERAREHWLERWMK